jgi:hypothetical protein
MTIEQLREQIDEKNRQTSQLELANWMREKPQRYFVYVKARTNTERIGCNPPDERYLRGTITTWVGDELGIVFGGLPYRDNFGGERVAIDVVGNNGVIYYGTYYKSSGDYCRLKAYADQEKARKRYSSCEAYRTKLLS